MSEYGFQSVWSYKGQIDKLNINGVHPTIQRWYHNFLHDRQQRVKITKSFSEWNTVNGRVPQSTLSGPELFVHMLSDFNTAARCVKYVDDSTLVEI